MCSVNGVRTDGMSLNALSGEIKSGPPMARLRFMRLATTESSVPGF
jgi:hypothetical protein